MFISTDRTTQFQRIAASNAMDTHAIGRKALVDNRACAATQLKRKKLNEAETAESEITQKSAVPLQRAVDNDAPKGTRIVIDNPGASDFGDVGTIIRRSTVEENCMAVEFDNEKGVLYRVYHYEMSPLASDSETAYKGLAASFSITARNPDADVVIVGTFDLTDLGARTAEFTAFHNTRQVGNLSVESYPGTGFYLTDINTSKVAPEYRVNGLGAVLLHTASVMALKFGHHQIDLSATKKKEIHPGPFYHKFGFQTEVDWGTNLAQYLSEHGNKTINMKGNSQEVATQTGIYVDTKNWHFGQWRGQ